MNLSEALDATMQEFNLTGKWLSDKTGLSEQTVSTCRSGERIRSDSLERILKALPPQAKAFFSNKFFMTETNNNGKSPSAPDLETLSSISGELQKDLGIVIAWCGGNTGTTHITGSTVFQINLPNADDKQKEIVMSAITDLIRSEGQSRSTKVQSKSPKSPNVQS
jgi:DNA-binding Xre family transcriptional regulator